MNQPLEDFPEFESVKNVLSWDPSLEDQNSNHFDSFLFCQDCRVTFENVGSLHKHLIDNHISDPYVLLQRLTPEYLRRLNQKKGRQRKGAFARKRVQSYLQPRVKSTKKTPLKLKLKVSGDSSSRSFEVVPPKVLIGPGGVFSLNGEVLGEVKTEDFLSAVEWGKSLEGATEQPSVANTGERTFDEVPNSCEKENSVDSLSNEDALGDNVSDLELPPNKDGNHESLAIEKEELDIPPSPEPDPTTSSLQSPPTSPGEEITSPLRIPTEDDDELSPPPGEQLERELLHSDSESNFPQSPNMVEINNSAVADVRSPSFPTPSPSAPSGQPTPPSEPQTVPQSSETDASDENSEEQDLSNSGQLRCEDESDGANDNFVWDDVGSNDADINAENSNSQALEERDPLLLNDNSSTAADECQSELEGNPHAGAIDATDQSILRGFLSEHGSERSNVPVTGVSGLENFNLGSEYISLERLGDNAVICDVCGERAADQTALQDHKFRAGHFKCTQPECGGIVFPSSDELIAHQQNVHGNAQFSSSNILNQSQPAINQQTAPVQQLVQQVQRLPVPQMTMQPLNKAQPPHSSALSQQLSSGMVTLISSQQGQFSGAVCRPPPLYPAPAANLMPQQPPPYPGPQPQHVMFSQPYPHGQPFPGVPRQPVQLQPRPYSSMMQQMTQHTVRQQVPRVVSNVVRNMTAPQASALQAAKRGMPVSSSSPGSKQRRMDMLIPDRHDDADCHVIAMQKRTESGPVITGVQGSPNAQGVPSSRQSSQTDSTINLTDSITLSVRQQNANVSNGGGKSRNDANTVASLLATRGITVTPAGGAIRGNQPQPQNQGPQPSVQHRTGLNRQSMAPAPAPPPAPPPPQPVTTLNLNSAISIIPTASARPKTNQQMQQPQQPSANFAVPQGRTANRPQQQAQVERPPRPPTVDLTGDGPPPPPAYSHMGGRGRGRGRGGGMIGRNICQLCDKQFPTLDSLNQHMVTHRPGKLPFRCNMCTAQYPTQQGLLQHRQTYHKESPSQMGSELVLPVVDLKQPATLNRLNSLGVRHYIPLSQLSNQSGGVLGLPIVSLEGGRIPSASLSALGAATILTLGPLRQLPR